MTIALTSHRPRDRHRADPDARPHPNRQAGERWVHRRRGTGRGTDRLEIPGFWVQRGHFRMASVQV